jgi:hypothetical protein
MTKIFLFLSFISLSFISYGQEKKIIDGDELFLKDSLDGRLFFWVQLNEVIKTQMHYGLPMIYGPLLIPGGGRTENPMKVSLNIGLNMKLKS